jgi:triacylglycerol esterase/lipase EstA (alpha/beta hydrolase family)
MSAEPDKKRPRKKRWILVPTVAALAIVGYLWMADQFREEEKQLRSDLRQTVEKQFPEQAAEVAESFGLSRFDVDVDPANLLRPAGQPVVLIHGLDEPGSIWMNLAPQLHNSGFDVWIMRYPNDQPIVDSARLLFDHLKMLPLAGVHQVALVGHSMGGLVAREMLTSPHLGYQQSAAIGEVPQAVALVMVGTPNHGSELARFRILTEVRDQLVQLAKGETNWLGGILDGAGEAKIDLLPGSRFLTALNARANPQGVELMVIAGIASPWSERQIDRFIAGIQHRLPAESESMLMDLKRSLASLTNNLGDGLVTVESTRLEGALHRMVKGSHASMIRNLTPNSERVPPSVPIIVDFLQQVFSDLDV